MEGDLLYHAVHGVCRVDRINKQKQSGKEVLTYSLVPKAANQMKVRYVIAATDMGISGFHLFVSVREANKILEYLKAGDIEAVPSGVDPKAVPSSASQNQTWGLAQGILSFSHDKFEAKDQRKRQMLERSAKGLVGELAFVFKSTMKEAAVRVRKNLAHTSKINPSVLVALAHASED